MKKKPRVGQIPVENRADRRIGERQSEVEIKDRNLTLCQSAVCVDGARSKCVLSGNGYCFTKALQNKILPFDWSEDSAAEHALGHGQWAMTAGNRRKQS